MGKDLYKSSSPSLSSKSPSPLPSLTPVTPGHSFHCQATNTARKFFLVSAQVFHELGSVINSCPMSCRYFRVFAVLLSVKDLETYITSPFCLLSSRLSTFDPFTLSSEMTFSRLQVTFLAFATTFG